MSSSYAREYSRDGKHFGFINSQGKFVVYDVETSNVNQIYTPNLHLNVPCTCFTWVEIGGVGAGGGPNSAKKKKKRGSVGGEFVTPLKTYVAFGTSRGGIALYGLASANIEKVFKGPGHSGPITTICVHGDCLLTAGADGKVIEWSLSACQQRKVHNLGVEKLTCLSVVKEEGSWILSGTKQLKLWDLRKGTVVKTLIGHTSNTVLVSRIVTQDGRAYALLTGSTNDRNISMWSVEGDEKAPIGLFAMDDAPAFFSTRMVGAKLHLVAASRSGVAYYYIKTLDKINVNKPIKANHTYEVALDAVRTGSKTVDRLPIFTASVEFSPHQHQLLVGYGSDLGLKFEQITIDKGVKQNVIIREQIKGLLAKDKSEKDFKAKTPTVDKAIAEFLNPVNAGRKTIKTMKTVEMPMEARLENLALLDDGDSKSRINQKNMIHLLVQGLHSKDTEMLRSVFSKNDLELIQRTAERVPAQYVSVLLDELSNLMQKKTVHVATAVCWLKALIHSHASQLMALGSENLLSNFGSCLGIIEYRVEHANSLSKLSGRLEMLVSQIDRTERLTKHPEQMVYSNVLIYQEEEESDVDSVIGKENGASEDEYDRVMDENGPLGNDVQDGPQGNDDEEVRQGNDAEDDEEETPMAGSFVRIRNGASHGSLHVDEESSSDDEDEYDEEMDVSD